MFNTVQRKPRFIAWLLTAMLLWVGAVAVAHELDHALDHHHELCALHHYADHHGSLPSSCAHPPAPPIEARLDLPPSYLFVSESRPAPYAVRAPPQV
jgi:hypothetical protein